MQHKVKVTVIDKKLYPELQAQFCTDADAGACPCYQVGDEFIFERYGSADDFWHMGLDTLKQSVNGEDVTAGGKAFPHCSEAWDAVSRYIYTGLQGGSIMRGWMKDERVMIACCSDGTRPVIFKIERMDYMAVYVEGIGCDMCRGKIREALKKTDGVTDVVFKNEATDGEYIEVFLDVERKVTETQLTDAVEGCGAYHIVRME